MSEARPSIPIRLPETPAEALGPTVRERVVIAGHALVICRPDAVDRLDEYSISADSAAGEYLPLWAHLWPGSHLLAKAVLEEPWSQVGTGESLQALEIGCGLGLPGIVALARGLRVIFSDYDAASLRYAAESARLNGFTDFSLLQMDWSSPPRDLRVPVVLGSDVAYEMRMVQPLVTFLKRVLMPEGVCLLLERDRVQTPALLEALSAADLPFTQQEIQAEDSAGSPVRGTLYRIRSAWSAE